MLHATPFSEADRSSRKLLTGSSSKVCKRASTIFSITFPREGNREIGLNSPGSFWGIRKIVASYQDCGTELCKKKEGEQSFPLCVDSWVHTVVGTLSAPVVVFLQREGRGSLSALFILRVGHNQRGCSDDIFPQRVVPCERLYVCWVGRAAGLFCS